MRVWSTPPSIPVSSELRTAVGGHPLIARLLAQRGITEPQRAQAFLDPAQYHPADARALPGLEAASEFIRQAIAKGEPIRVWGDFDVDGQSATALLLEALGAAGALVSYDLPARKEGHGLNMRAIRQATDDGIRLMITCDTGTSDVDLVNQANKLGLGIIITDHHDLPDILPPALYIVNPKLLPQEHPSYQLSGAGVAYYLARGLLENTPAAGKLNGLLELAVLGLVADVAYQVDDVRYLIQLGMQALRQTQRPGLRALYAAAEVDAVHLSEDDIGFKIAPRLNAAGRLADASLALRLLLTQDAQEALALAEQLEMLNRDRQALTEATVNAAEHRLQQDSELLRQSVLVIDGDSWEEGILGLAASALVQRYNRPSIVISHLGARSVGSARSVAGIDIHQAIASQQHLLEREGGHPMAAGFSLKRENLSQFRQGVVEWVSSQARVEQLGKALNIEAQIPWLDLSLPLAEQVGRLAPFGAGNPKPVLSTNAAMFLRSEDISRRQITPHRRLYCADETGRQLAFTWFNSATETMPEPGQILDLAFTIQSSYWSQKARLNLEVVDWRSHVRDAEVGAESITAGFELVDWRQAGNREQLLAKVRADYGDNGVVWAEGIRGSPDAAYTRCQLYALSTHPIALAVLTPPPSPETFQQVLNELKPQVLILLPPLEPANLSAQEFIATVAGMVRAALEDNKRQGVLDIERMAARLGARTEAVVAALRGLEASRVFDLVEENASLRAQAIADNIPYGAEENSDEQPDTVFLKRASEQARDALLYQLRETRAYRSAYREMSAQALVRSEPSPSAR
ncbi:MAG: single-stranded-DNA-specific exonuclease RecJ [Chloroflexi bacterium]|nr:single-stranded-DNA-specific exonuclease RecJ [Chloroflexota bacterium]